MSRVKGKLIAALLRRGGVAILAAVAGVLLAHAPASGMPDRYYKVESIRLPKGVAPEVGGLAFNAAGEIVVILRRHGILIGRPHKEPGKFTWRQFANSSLHNPMGVLLIGPGEMLVPTMQELTRIKDTDGDGTADLYETVCADGWGVSGNYHETNGGPVPDGKGAWFIAVGTASHNGPTMDFVRGKYSKIGRRGRNFSSVAYKGWVVKVLPDGRSIPWASGFRANNGMTMSPDGKLYVTDNQGDWRGTSPLFHVEKGDFCGHPSSLVWDPEFYPAKGDPLKYPIPKLDAMRKRAAVLFPQGMMCNSPAEPIFDTTAGKFGPFAGQMFVGDVAGRRVLRVMLEEVDGLMQGACTKFIDGSGLRGGNNRFVFSPDGGSLYVGQTYRGWGRPAEGLQRIVYKGKPPLEVKTMRLAKDGFRLTFTRPVKQDAAGKKAYSLIRYHYDYGHRYGSSQRDKKSVSIRSVKLSLDGRRVYLKTDELVPRKVYQLDLSGIKAADDGADLVNRTLCYTANRLVK